MPKDPKIILKILSENNGYIDNLYRYLYIPEFYQIAYNNIYQKSSQMTPASDGSTIDGMSTERIDKLIQSLHDKSYQPTPLRKVQISKKNGEMRSVNIPSFEDKLVQEVIRMILEALYEHTFLDCSHGFRPNRSCHTALMYVKQKFKGTKWWIKINIKECFDSINRQRLIQILAERIKEQKFLNLINKFLKAEYIEDWKYHKTYSGTPQGNIISPILANIYLNELDKFIMNIKDKFDKGIKRQDDKTYYKLSRKVCNIAKAIKEDKNVDINKVKLKQLIKDKKEYSKKYGTLDNFDPNFRRIQYVRYADDILISIIGSKNETQIIQKQIIDFLDEQLSLKLNSEKSKIVHNTKLIRFLGYDLGIMKSESRRHINGHIGLYLPHDIAVDFILNNNFGKYIIHKKTGKSKLKSVSLIQTINNEELEILFIYNTKIRGFYNYYKLASNVCKLSKFNYIVTVSFLKTLATKYKITCAKLYKNKKYAKRENNKTIVGITYKDKFYELYNGPFTVVKEIQYNKNIDIIENINKYFARTSLIDRLEAKECEFCHSTTGPFEVHHIKKLKDLKGKSTYERFMISRKRKTIVLCKSCHNKLHNGIL